MLSITSEEIDEIDMKIIAALTRDARTKLIDIAEDCSISSSAVLKRIQKLKALGVIVGTSVVVKQDMFGYSLKASIGMVVDNTKEDQIAEKIRACPNVIVCFKCIGKYNMWVFMIAHDMDELNNVTQSIRDLSGIRDFVTNIWIGDPVFNQGIHEPTSTTNLVSIDKTDLRIVKELIEDAQMPFMKIGEKLGISPSTVRKRYLRMKENGVIQNCSILVDRSKLGYQGTMLLLIANLANAHTKQIINALKKIQDIIIITRVMGDFDIFAVTIVKDLKHVAEIVKRVKKIPQVERLEAVLLTHTYFAYAPIPNSKIKINNIGL